jgi:hypothetical protein
MPLKVEFQGSRVTSDGGLILVRELDERLGFGELIKQHLRDSRGKNAQFGFADLLRQSIYCRLGGYEDLNDAERLSQGPTFRLISSEKICDRGVALPSRLQSFETEMLAEDANFAGLAGLSRALIRRRFQCTVGKNKAPTTGISNRPAAFIQPRRRLSGGKAASRQRAQRRGLGETSAAGDRAATEAEQGSGVSSRRRLRQARDLRGAGKPVREVRHPYSGQREPGAVGKETDQLRKNRPAFVHPSLLSL